MSNKFHRGERLKSRKEIGHLFGKGSESLSAYPLRLMYAPTRAKRGADRYQAAFVVPKRRYKRAVDRNLIKRRMWESYRLQKSSLPPPALLPASGEAAADGNLRQYALLFIYVGKESLPFRYLNRKMRKVLLELAGRIESEKA